MKFALCLVLVAACATSGVDSDDGGGDARPSFVPQEYVATPFGWFHPDCVAQAETSGEHGNVITACAHEHFTQASVPDAAKQQTDGWKSSEWYQSTPMQSVAGSWIVPAAPTAKASQTLYYFPSLEPPTYDDIVQPVLAWNGFGDNAWTMTSWNCCETGNVWHSTSIPVSAGDVVYGSAVGSNCDATGVCANWTILSGDHNTGATVTLAATSTETMTAAQGGVLETYGVTKCTELAKPVTFTAVEMQYVGGAAVAPTWTNDIVSKPTPSCGYAATGAVEADGSSKIVITDKI